jgi:outer membrane protein TolC
VGSTSRLAEAGEMLQTEAALFTIERASQSRVLLKFRGDAAEVEQRLRSLLGVSPDAPLELQSTLVATTDFDQPTAGAAAERNLTLVRLRDEYEVAERTLYREVRKQYPDLTIGPLADFDQGQTMLGFSLALPIPILNANKQGIAQAIAERELARAAFETEYDRLVGSLAATQVRIETLREQRNLIESEIAPLVDRQLGDAQRLLGLGEGEGLILLESLSRVGQTRMELIETRLAESLAESELSHLLGPPAPSIETSENPTDQNATTAGHAGSRLPKVTP